MRKKFAVVLLVALLSVATAAAQIGFGGVVYDPTNYHNALLRYFQLQQQLIQLRNSYAQLVSQYQLALQMAQNLKNMPARYRASFSQWRGATASDSYANTAGWIQGVNSGQLDTVLRGYHQATTALSLYAEAALSGMTPEELSRVKSQYASVELSDGANTNALATVGSIRGNAQRLDTQIDNLEQDSFSEDPGLNSEVQVLNKINAANVLTLRSVQDSNKLLASLLEEQIISSKQQRELTANAINSDITRRATLSGNLGRVTSTLTDSLQDFRMP
jgi:hypothetical protein